MITAPPRPRRGRALVAALACLLAAVAGCSSGGSATSRVDADTRTVTINVGYQPLYAEAWSAVVNKQLQLWRAYMPDGYDVRVKWTSAPTGAVIVTGMVGKKLDIGYTGDMPSINAMSNPGTRIVGTATTWSRGQQCGLIAVPDGSTIASVEDLRGKTIAVPVGSCLHFFLLQLLEKTGLENHVTVKNMAPDAIQTGFKSGGFDAGVLQEPMMSRVLAAGDAHLLTTGADYGDIDASNLLMSKDFYQGTGAWSSVPKVDGVSAFAVAWQKANLAALNVMATDEAKTVSTIAADLPDYPSDVIRRSIYLPAGAGQPAPRLQLDADWRGTPAGTLLTSTGPAFLQGLGAAKGFDPGRAMEPRALELAAEQLVADGSTWPVVRQVGGGASVGALAIPHG